MVESFVPPTKEVYADDDLVYVDPKERVVIGLVQWSNAGRPKTLVMRRIEEEVDEEDPKGKRRLRRQRSYPWGTYRTMKRIFKVEGKIFEERPMITLDEAIERCLKEPFWDIVPRVMPPDVAEEGAPSAA